MQTWSEFKAIRNIHCNCGGPSYGTDHSPDCELERGRELWEELKAEEEYEQSVEDCIPVPVIHITMENLLNLCKKENS